MDLSTQKNKPCIEEHGSKHEAWWEEQLRAHIVNHKWETESELNMAPRPAPGTIHPPVRSHLLSFSNQLGTESLDARACEGHSHSNHYTMYPKNGCNSSSEGSEMLLYIHVGVDITCSYKYTK